MSKRQSSPFWLVMLIFVVFLAIVVIGMTHIPGAAILAVPGIPLFYGEWRRENR